MSIACLNINALELTDSSQHPAETQTLERGSEGRGRAVAVDADQVGEQTSDVWSGHGSTGDDVRSLSAFPISCYSPGVGRTSSSEIRTVVLPIQLLVTSVPGAKMSTTEP